MSVQVGSPAVGGTEGKTFSPRWSGLGMELTRSDRVALLVAVVVVAAVVGVSAVFLSGDDGPRPVEVVPGEADAVAVVEGDVVTHPTTRRLANATLARAGEPPRYDRLLGAVEEQVGLRPERVEWVAAFARYPNRTAVVTPTRGYAGVVVSADWDQETLVDSARDSDIGVERRTYRGTPVYRLDRTVDVYVAVLGARTFAVSTSERVVRDAVDVRRGDAPGLSEGLRTALSDRRDASVVRMAARVPADRLESGTPEGLERALSVDRVAVEYTAFNDTHVGVRTTLYVESEAAATDLRQLLSAAPALVGPRLDNETVTAALREVEVERDGATVSLSYTDDVDGVLALGDGVAAVVGDAAGEVPLGLRPVPARETAARPRVAA